MAYKLWRGKYKSGTPDVSYENGKVWSGKYTSGTPAARYDGPDGGGAAAAAFLLFLG